MISGRIVFSDNFIVTVQSNFVARAIKGKRFYEERDATKRNKGTKEKQ